jgi:hypothetical protein
VNPEGLEGRCYQIPTPDLLDTRLHAPRHPRLLRTAASISELLNFDSYTKFLTADQI